MDQQTRLIRRRSVLQVLLAGAAFSALPQTSAHADSIPPPPPSAPEAAPAGAPYSIIGLL